MRTIAILALSLAACGGTEAPSETTAAAPSTEAHADGHEAHRDEAHADAHEADGHAHADEGDCAGHADGEACDCGSHAAADGAADGEWTQFGEPVSDATEVALASLLDNPSDYTGQTVRVEGTISDVCQMAGCWMVIADGERTMRVTMKDHAFAVAKDSATKIGTIEGVVIAREADPERAAHFASESANPDAMPENSGAAMLYEINAAGVRIKNG